MFLAAIVSQGPGLHAILDIRDDHREQPWVLDLANEARRLSVCETGACVLYEPASDAWRARPLGCRSKLCPVCCRERAARACDRWRAVLTAAVNDGATLRHWTFTQPQQQVDGGLVLPDELRYGWRGTVASDGVVARAVGGEGLGAAYVRLRSALTAFRDNSRTKHLVKPALGGHLVGCEWTGRGRDGVPRWHAHAHVLGCTPTGIEVDEDAVIAAWCQLTGGSPRAQHVRVVEPDAVAEVLKYPVKPAHLTSAQRIETLAFMRGMHPHHLAGSWSPLSRARRDPDSCWSRWLRARPPPPEYQRLQYIPDSDAERRGECAPSLYTGQVTEGWTMFALRSRDGEWREWADRAERFAALIGTDTGLGGVMPPPEPGEDRDEDWFADA